MTYIITDWMNNVCFDSDCKDLKTFHEADMELDYCLIKIYGEDCNLEEEREEYYIQEYSKEIDRLMWIGNRYVLKSNYYEGVA